MRTLWTGESEGNMRTLWTGESEGNMRTLWTGESEGNIGLYGQVSQRGAQGLRTG